MPNESLVRICGALQKSIVHARAFVVKLRKVNPALVCSLAVIHMLLQTHIDVWLALSILWQLFTRCFKTIWACIQDPCSKNEGTYDLWVLTDSPMVEFARFNNSKVGHRLAAHSHVCHVATRVAVHPYMVM